MSNAGFFSHFPFFTPPPQSTQEALDATEDLNSRVRRMVQAMSQTLPKLDFTVDEATAPAWYDPETGTMNFR